MPWVTGPCCSRIRWQLCELLHSVIAEAIQRANVKPFPHSWRGQVSILRPGRSKVLPTHTPESRLPQVSLVTTPVRSIDSNSSPTPFGVDQLPWPHLGHLLFALLL